MRPRYLLPLAMVTIGLVTTAVVEIALATALLGGCTRGGSDRAGVGGDSVAGREVFAAAACGSCHTLAAAGSRGRRGPNLDRHAVAHRHTSSEVAAIVRNGRGAMPPFRARLSEEQIRDVAAFVVAASGSDR